MIEFIQETGSTNSDLLARLGEGQYIPEGQWLVTDRQKSGRGRQGRDWFDGTGNFMGSTVVHRAASDPPTPTLALLTGLALYETCLLILPNPASLSLKWPNDLLFGRAKLAGILLEAQGTSVVVGIGVNLVAAPELKDREAIALAQLGPATKRNDFAIRLAAQFAIELDRWRSYGLDTVLRRWTGAAHPVGTALSVHDANMIKLTGTFAGLAHDGSLLLRLADGTTRAIYAGDILLA
ncbi:MAG: biotin--[acetyl-CoA-carboxylase] ligase [Pontixanthobacter sp.]